MKTRNFFTFALTAALVLAAAMPASAQLHPSVLKYPDEDFKPRYAGEAVLSNGVRVFYVEDHEIPVVSLQARFRGGGLYNPAGKEGLAELTADCMRSAGTKKWDPDALDEALEDRAVRVWVYDSGEFMSAGTNALTKEFPWALETLVEVLRNPVFRADRVKVKRGEMLDWVARRWDYPGSITWRKFQEAVYGKDVPWGRDTSRESINAITTKDLKDFHARTFVASRMMLGVYGDFQKDDMLARLEAAFASFPAGSPELPAIPKVEDKLEPKVLYVHKPGLRQSSIMLGHLGVNRHDPDMRRIEVMNNILSGSMDSRLFNKVREEKGLAYSVWAGLGGNLDRGTFGAGCQTKPETTVQAIEAVLTEIRRMRDELPVEREMELAKRSTVNSFVFQFEDASDVLWKSMSNVLYGYPRDYWDTYLDQIQAVTPEQVRETALKHIHPEKFVIVVVGDESKFDKPLSSLGLEVVPLALE